MLLAMRRCPIHRQHIGNVSIGFCLAPIDVSEGLAGSIQHLIAAWNLFDRPWLPGSASLGAPDRDEILVVVAVLKFDDTDYHNLIDLLVEAVKVTEDGPPPLSGSRG